MDRVRILRISTELLFGLLTAGDHPTHAYTVGKDPIPADAELVNVRHAWPNQVEILIRSASFEPIEAGKEPPQQTPEMWRATWPHEKLLRILIQEGRISVNDARRIMAEASQPLSEDAVTALKEIAKRVTDIIG